MNKPAILTTLVLGAALVGALWAHTPARADDEATPDLDAMNSFMGLMQRHIEMADAWTQLLQRDDASAYLAATGILEIYKEQGKVLEAVPHLRAMLESGRLDPVGRRAILFTLRDALKEGGKHEEAVEVLKAIVAM